MVSSQGRFRKAAGSQDSGISVAGTHRIDNRGGCNGRAADAAIAGVKRASPASSVECHGAEIERFYQPRHDVTFISRAIKRVLNVCKLRFVDFEQIRVMKRSGHGFEVDVGRPHIDVTKAYDAIAVTGKKTLHLAAAGIGSLQQGAEINHLCTIRIQRSGGVEVKVVVGHILADVKMRNALLIQIHTDRSRGMSVVNLDVGFVKAVLYQQVNNAPPVLIVPYAGEEPHRKSQLSEMECKIERRAADPLVILKNVDENLTDDNNHMLLLG